MNGLELPVDVVSQSALADTIKKNSRTLLSLCLQLNAQGTVLLAPVIKRCKALQGFGVQVIGGSHHATAVLADILGHLNNLFYLTILCDLDDVGFSSIVPSVERMASRLRVLTLDRTQLSIVAIVSLLTATTKLTDLRLGSISLGDDGLRELIPCLQQLPALTGLRLTRAGLSWRSLVDIEELLLRMPLMKECSVSVSKDSSHSISSLQSPTLQVTESIPNAETAHLLKAGGLVETKCFCLENKRGQTVYVFLEEE